MLTHIFLLLLARQFLAFLSRCEGSEKKRKWICLEQMGYNVHGMMAATTLDPENSSCFIPKKG